MEFFANKSLRNLNTFGIEALTRWFTHFSSPDELAGALASFPRTGDSADDSGTGYSRWGRLLILGGGSNILLTGNFDGLVLHNRIRGIRLVHEDERHVYVNAGAGENWHGFVTYCLERNWAGVENLSLIPGSVGAAPMQNIGAYGVEIKQVFHELEAWDLEDRKTVIFSLNDSEFGYRESVFKHRYRGRFVILNVTFRLDKFPRYHTKYGAIREELEKAGIRELSIRAISDAVIRIRRSKLPDPAEIGNAGSFFKNPTVSTAQFEKLKAAHPGIVGYPNVQDAPRPGESAAPGNAPRPGQGPKSSPTPEPGDPGVKLAAGWLIEQCGWKGFRRGDAGCHSRQALVLVNYGNASGKEIYDLSEDILRSVEARFGVTLEREVNIIS